MKKMKKPKAGAKKSFSDASTGSEFRRDLVSGDWILVSAKRAKRPHSKSTKRALLDPSKKGCPFDDPQAGGSPAPLLWLSYPESDTESFKNWWVQIIPNKYPAVEPHEICPSRERNGPYTKMYGAGFHEVIITRDHKRRISEMTSAEAEVLLYAYQNRWHTLARKKCINYILIFHNQGPRAGSTIFHPHSQLIALPIIPPDVYRSLKGSRLYFEKNKKCVHCDMLDWERKKGTRIVYENKHFVALEPFASRVSYETRIFPKKHADNFENISDKERMSLADSTINVLSKLKKTLDDPDYNLFIHTAPVKNGTHDYYHWHIEILPKTSVWAGVELGTGIEVVAVSPENAAEELRRH